MVDTRGATDRVPKLLLHVERDDAPAAWGELWSRLCLFGDDASPAGLAALPRLANMTATRPRALELACAIARAALQYPDGEKRLTPHADVLAELRNRMDEQLRTSPADYSRHLCDLLVLHGRHHWITRLDDLADDFYTMPCPHCRATVTIAISPDGCFSEIRDNTPATTERIPLHAAPSDKLADPGRWMHATAVRDRKEQLAKTIRQLCGHVECPRCASMLSATHRDTTTDRSRDTFVDPRQAVRPLQHSAWEWVPGRPAALN